MIMRLYIKKKKMEWAAHADTTTMSSRNAISAEGRPYFAAAHRRRGCFLCSKDNETAVQQPEAKTRHPAWLERLVCPPPLELHGVGSVAQYTGFLPRTGRLAAQGSRGPSKRW